MNRKGCVRDREWNQDDVLVDIGQGCGHRLPAGPPARSNQHLSCPPPPVAVSASLDADVGVRREVKRDGEAGKGKSEPRECK